VANPHAQRGRETYIGVVCSDTKWFETARKESAQAADAMASARAKHIRSLGSIPLVVLSAGQASVTAGRGISAEVVEQMQVVQNELQAELVALSSNGKRVIAQESGHYIQVSQPELVVDAIREVVEAARR